MEHCLLNRGRTHMWRSAVITTEIDSDGAKVCVCVSVSVSVCVCVRDDCLLFVERSPAVCGLLLKGFQPKHFLLPRLLIDTPAISSVGLG